MTPGLNFSTNELHRSAAGAAGNGTMGSASRAFSSQSSAPPPPTAESEWWGRLASGNTLIPGAGISEADESLGRSSCLLYTSPSPRDKRQSRMPSSA